MTESQLQSRILLELGSKSHIRLFRNQVGSGWVASGATNMPDGRVILDHPRHVRMGLHVGSGDLIGWKTITVKPEHVGKPLAVFLSVEIKTERGRVSPDQHNWLQTVQESGGIAAVCRSVEQARLIVP